MFLIKVNLGGWRRCVLISLYPNEKHIFLFYLCISINVMRSMLAAQCCLFLGVLGCSKMVVYATNLFSLKLHFSDRTGRSHCLTAFRPARKCLWFRLGIRSNRARKVTVYNQQVRLRPSPASPDSVAADHISREQSLRSSS